ncbi:MAG: YraN family protein [Bacteroidetes bacterium]|nr:MAG: YraN family protein [Bacteroidota bacterium]
MTSKELGRIGEAMAAKHLLEMAYTIHSKNYIYDRAEVDIIAEHKGMLVFVEVKTRMSAYLSDPSLLISRKKQNQIIKAADNYAREFHPEKESRFDIIVIITNDKYTSLEHIVDAFYPMI